MTNIRTTRPDGTEVRTRQGARADAATGVLDLRDEDERSGDPEVTDEVLLVDEPAVAPRSVVAGIIGAICVYELVVNALNAVLGTTIPTITNGLRRLSLRGFVNGLAVPWFTDVVLLVAGAVMSLVPTRGGHGRR